MKPGLISQEAIRAAKSIRKTALVCAIVMIFILLLSFFAADIDAELGEAVEEYSTVLYGIVAFVSLGVMFTIFRLRKVIQSYAKYTNLFVHADETARDVAGRTIDDEAAQGKVFVDEYQYSGRSPKGGRVILLPSYLLLCQYMRITAIPVGRIFWVCAQVGFKGGPYVVRLRVFAENKIYSLDGVDVDHYKNIADKLYQHIPNIFYEYDTYDLSYKLEELFNKDYNKFLEFYETHKQKFFKKDPDTE